MSAEKLTANTSNNSANNSLSPSNKSYKNSNVCLVFEGAA